MLKENTIKVHGAMTGVLEKANGEVITIKEDNIILNEGYDFICDALANSASRPAVMDHISIGTDTAEAMETQGGVLAMLGCNPATYAHTPGTKSFTLTTVFEAGEGIGAITEAGVCNAVGGTDAEVFLDRLTFAVINKESDDTFTVTFTFTFA